MTVTAASSTTIVSRYLSAVVAGSGVTPRQIDIWRRAGALGASHVGLGSGNRDTWTDQEAAALRALGALSDDLRSLSLVMSVDLVRRLWPELMVTGRASVRLATLYIEVDASS